jgi:hypothetical protein
VKHRAAPLTARSLGAVVSLLATSTLGCGYQRAHAAPSSSSSSSTPHIRVVAGTSHVADPSAMPGVLEGARAALGDESALGDDGSSLVIDVESVGEESSGVLDRPGAPLARGSSASMTAHGRLVRAGGGDGIDLGDVTMRASSSAEPTAASDALHRDDALHDLARRVGAELSRRALHRAAEFGSAGAVAPRDAR